MQACLAHMHAHGLLLHAGMPKIRMATSQACRRVFTVLHCLPPLNFPARCHHHARPAVSYGGGLQSVLVPERLASRNSALLYPPPPSPPSRRALNASMDTPLPLPFGWLPERSLRFAARTLVTHALSDAAVPTLRHAHQQMTIERVKIKLSFHCGTSPSAMFLQLLDESGNVCATLSEDHRMLGYYSPHNG